eukprot:TRINITY_DN5518_c0_g1_i1.p1 TRINITY_DN5518_c0_g1~~TRINITY_DN5518_c0_g1_i1.p1  ORF type:complete len:874 (+),score=301.72 TRINITY_DN5518_c0_g1_i1:121-2742(+)
MQMDAASDSGSSAEMLVGNEPNAGGQGKGGRRAGRTWFTWLNHKLDAVHEMVDIRSASRHMTVEEREALQGYQTLDYVMRYSNVYREHLRTPEVRDNMQKWALFGLVGAVTGILAFVIRQSIDLLTDLRMGTVAKILDVSAVNRTPVEKYFLAWGFMILTGAALVAFASSIVVYYWRPAAGSGVEEVIAYLNGVDMPKVFNVRTGLVKLASCVASVSSGLPCGPEGPLIHLGAVTGAGLTQGRSKSLKCTTGLFKKFRNASDHRDFITAGAAAGISSAFGAPIGGLLFVMEEMSTHWKPSLTWMIFFCSMISYCSTSLLNSAFDAWAPTGTFGWFLNKAAVLFEVKTIIQLNILAIFPAFIIGTLGGLLGSLFTILNLRFIIWRRRVILPTPWKRVLEPIVVIVLFSTISLLLPVLSECAPIKPTGEVGSGAAWVTENSSSLATFLCKDNNTYSPIATLTLSSNEGTVRRLFSRNTDPEFDTLCLVTFFLLYFVFACYTAGTSLSSGLLVPMILMGATMGRLVGHVLVQYTNASTVGNLEHQWIDPGVFALIGAGAFVGGVSRLTVSLVVIMLEISAELHFLLPIMLAVMTAGWVGNFLTPPLYHAYLELKNVPIMPLEIENMKLDLSLHTAFEAVSAEPVTLPVRSGVRKVCELLRMHQHNCFPVLNERGAFVGTILRKELLLLLRTPAVFDKDGAPGRHLDHAGIRDREEHLFLEPPITDWRTVIHDDDFGALLDLAPYMNTSPFTVQDTFSLDLTYNLFTALGLRHLIVLKRNRCMGVITRKDLLYHTLEERLGNRALQSYFSSNRPAWTDEDEERANAEDIEHGLLSTSAHSHSPNLSAARSRSVSPSVSPSVAPPTVSPVTLPRAQPE